MFRSAQDACQQAFACLAHPKSSHWILECDIKGCFDNISHEWLKANIPMDLSILSQFLNEGFIFGGTLYPTDNGTPQGGLISALLAKMTLDGIEVLLAKQFPRMKVHLIRYSDDCIITAPTREIAEYIKRNIQDFLIERGLELSEKKLLSYILMRVSIF